jgi:hypothetical protein
LFSDSLEEALAVFFNQIIFHCSLKKTLIDFVPDSYACSLAEAVTSFIV